MSENLESITVPVVIGFNYDEVVGSLSLIKAALPEKPEFVFSLGFRTDFPEGQSNCYELVCVSLMQDTEYVAYLNASGLPVNADNCRSGAESFKAWLEQQPDKRSVEQLSTNCKWLIDCIDEIHNALCPERGGAWQSRAKKAVEAAKVKAKPSEAATEACGSSPANLAGSRMIVSQNMVDSIVARAKRSDCGLKEPEKGPHSYDIAQYEPRSLHDLAIMLVSAHFAKWDIISAVTAALEEVADRCANTEATK